jgi:rSAM/selenodomain-associated transferase 2
MISVIIPTHQEAANLPAVLDALDRCAGAREVMIADAGSSDGTVSIAARRGAAVIECPLRNRGAQMNLGAGAAVGDLLLFLHADTLLPPNALERIATALHRQQIVGGGFCRRYDSPSPVLRLTCVLADWRCRWFGWFLGDQGIFVRRSTFEALGGFREWPQFEDLDFARRLGRAGRVVTLTPPVISSARRFSRRGALWQTSADLLLTWRYLTSHKPPQ